MLKFGMLDFISKKNKCYTTINEIYIQQACKFSLRSNQELIYPSSIMGIYAICRYLQVADSGVGNPNRKITSYFFQDYWIYFASVPITLRKEEEKGPTKTLSPKKISDSVSGYDSKSSHIRIEIIIINQISKINHVHIKEYLMES